MNRKFLGYSSAVITCIFLLNGCFQDIPPVENPNPPSIEVVSPSGTYIGKEGRHSGLFYGIPFAQPPIGQLRFRAARAFEQTLGIVNASVHGAPCLQKYNSFEGLPSSFKTDGLAGSEDCLTLDVFMPYVSKYAPKLPTIFWIHGGGNANGAALIYDLSKFANKMGAVVVGVQYRLGPMGFLYDQAIVQTATEPLDATGNFALTDLHLALKWVQTNIASFGGDPKRVIIMGESAGARNVQALMAAPNGLTDGLVHGAISMSGYPRSVSIDQAVNLQSNERFSAHQGIANILIKQGKASSAEQAISYWEEQSQESRVNLLQSLSPEQLFEGFSNEERPVAFVDMVEDGVTVSKQGIQKVFEQGAELDVPMMIGSTRDEVKLFTALDPEFSSSILGVVRWLKDPEWFEKHNYYSSGFWRATGTNALASHRITNGRGDKTHIYRFDYDDYPTILFTDYGQLLGAGHGLELPIWFDQYNLFESISMLYPSEQDAWETRQTKNLRVTKHQKFKSYLTEYLHDWVHRADPGGHRDPTPKWHAATTGKGSQELNVMLMWPNDSTYFQQIESKVTLESLLQELSQDDSLSQAQKCEVVDDFSLSYAQRQQQAKIYCNN